MFKPRIFYTLGLWLLLPYIFFHLLWRGRKQPEYLQHIGERFGFYSRPSGKPVIWLHTVSVGETRAAATLIKRLREKYPDYQLLLTHITPTGRAASEQLYGDDVLRVYLPYDYPFAARRFLRHFKPQLGILLETEIWFNLIHASHEAGTPLLLLNARMSEKSARGYARFARLTRTALGELAAISAQTADDAKRLSQLGASNVSVMGNLKFDIEPPSAMLELGKQLRAQFGEDRKVLLAASTREGEEALLMDALTQVDLPGLLLVIVPRHPQRFDEVAALLKKHSLRFQRRSEGRPVAADTQAVLGDSMGEMFAYYAACDVAFIGGSLLPYGGQNLIEACSVGKPVLIGPHTFNFAEAAKQAIAERAAIEIQTAHELAAAAKELLNSTPQQAEMGLAGKKFSQKHGGATVNAIRLAKAHIKHRSS
ncbi:3-deoxy-D-manno-octulosonic acid transferase [Ferrigenium kumadai]|uniref:3-deoxy-D-manno-octulosonic acid transferase n=1 Tax=Ferrigenium kumadai TaxID=1682490 RepID=A0AAN1T2D3_9PROT|nr:lipid IV(A) 3-deoxy-D-manno-octulosonic acid transferase [Ferrigenium kumadai]BBJ00665.1 3-deoxy-D-manno-octulosonic acid transferase [Ferrigenium kumadai]